MHSFLTILFDTLFPLSSDAACVRDTTFVQLAALCAPQICGDATALASYREPHVHAFVHEAKFRRNERAIALLGQMLAEHLAEQMSAAFPSGTPRSLHLVPIPLSPERLRERGYNQTLEIARAAQKHLPRLHIHETLLKKIRHTPSQTSLSRNERLKNLERAFAAGVRSDTLPLSLDTPLTIFDDIVTTGSTLAEAARALTRAGFTRITKLAIAH